MDRLGFGTEFPHIIIHSRFVSHHEHGCDISSDAEHADLVRSYLIQPVVCEIVPDAGKLMIHHTVACHEVAVEVSPESTCLAPDKQRTVKIE